MDRAGVEDKLTVRREKAREPHSLSKQSCALPPCGHSSSSSIYSQPIRPSALESSSRSQTEEDSTVPTKKLQSPFIKKNDDKEKKIKRSGAGAKFEETREVVEESLTMPSLSVDMEHFRPYSSLWNGVFAT